MSDLSGLADAQYLGLQALARGPADSLPLFTGIGMFNLASNGRENGLIRMTPLEDAETSITDGGR